MNSKFFIISWIQWDYLDLSPNMLFSIWKCDLIFVEDIEHFKEFLDKNKVGFAWEVINLSSPFNINIYKDKILDYILSNKNIWIFESSWTACFIDPWFELVSYIYDLKKSNEIEIVPIPWTSALTLAISSSWFNIVNFTFWWFLWEKAKEEIVNSKIPVIYFNRINNLEEIKENLRFMIEIEYRYAFIWINLWKAWVNTKNKIIRWKYPEVYKEFIDFYKNNNILDDVTFIFR